MLKLNKSILVIIIAGAILVGWVFAFGAKRTMGPTQTEGIIIVPPAGLIFVTPDKKIIGSFSATKDGGIFRIYNHQEKIVAGMGADEDGGYISIINNQGGGAVDIDVTKKGGGRFPSLTTTRRLLQK